MKLKQNAEAPQCIAIYIEAWVWTQRAPGPTRRDCLHNGAATSESPHSPQMPDVFRISGSTRDLVAVVGISLTPVANFPSLRPRDDVSMDGRMWTVIVQTLDSCVDPFARARLPNTSRGLKLI